MSSSTFKASLRDFQLATDGPRVEQIEFLKLCSDRTGADVPERRSTSVSLEADKGWYRRRTGESATRVGVVEHAYRAAIQGDGVALSLRPDLILVPLSDRTRRLQRERFTVAPAVIAIYRTGSVDVLAVGCTEFVDLNFEAEIDGHPCRIVVTLALRVG